MRKRVVPLVLLVLIGLLASLSARVVVGIVIENWDISEDWDIGSAWYPLEGDDSPTFENPSHSDTIAGLSCTFEVDWTDDYGLGVGVLRTNNSGTWSYETPIALSGKTDTFSDSIVLNNSVGIMISYSFYANDTADQWSVTANYTLTTTAPDIEWSGGLIALSPTVAYVPDPTLLGGLNTEYAFDQYRLVDNVTFPSGAFQAPVNGSIFSINVTDTSDVDIEILNWFDGYGTVFSVSTSCNIDLNVSDRGTPSLVNGATYTYNGATKILALNATSAGTINVHWETGGYSTLGKAPSFEHSSEGYQTVYGFEIEWSRWLFAYSITYLESGTDEVENLTLTFEDGATLIYDPDELSVNLRLREYADPDGNMEVANRGHRALWDASTQTLTTSWKIRFLNYSSPRINQNTSTLINSNLAGSVLNQEFATYYFSTGVYNRTFIDIYFFTGLWVLGFVFCFISPIMLIRTIKSGEWERKPEVIGYAMVLFMVGCGLILIGLW